MTNKNIAVVGAGIVGASVAFHLSQCGMDVSVFDKNEPGSGASGHSFAWINAFSKQPRHYFDLNYRSMDRWPRFAEDLDEDIGLRWGGNITYCSDPDEGKRLASECERLNSWGYSARLISSEELSKLEPNLEIGQFHTGIYTREEGHVLPVKVAEACMNQIDAAGGKLHVGTEVESISQDGDKVLLHSSDGHMEFDKVVIAAGTDSTSLALTAGINLPQRRSPGVVVKTNPLPSFIKNLSTIYLPALSKEEKELHIRQSTDGVVMIGAGDQESEAEDDSQEYADKLIQRASLHFNQLSGVDAIRVPVGFRPMPEDGLPVIGSSPANNNIYLTLMHSGVTLAPLVGALAALEITTGISNADLDPYRPSRFSIRA
tara:strand:- start:117 stop:1235 length:1119 start_codon:yes stop_codon:yes gene_type:complete